MTTIRVSVAIDAINEMDINTALVVTSASAPTSKRAEMPSSICATITVEESSFPKIFIVDFGTSGCTDNQITRKGKLIITLSSPVITTGSKMTVQRVDYSINGLKLEGTIEYTNTTTVETIPQWTKKVINGKLTDLAGRVFTNSGIHTINQSAGFDTPYVLTDNIYEMTEGTHTVTSEKGTLTLTVQETLVKKYSCNFISEGKLKVQGGALNGVIDYGNNGCDSKYTYTHENGSVFSLNM